MPGRWRITLSRMPEGSWPERLLERAQALPEGQALRLVVNGSALEFECRDAMTVRSCGNISTRGYR